MPKFIDLLPELAAGSSLRYEDLDPISLNDENVIIWKCGIFPFTLNDFIRNDWEVVE